MIVNWYNLYSLHYLSISLTLYMSWALLTYFTYKKNPLTHNNYKMLMNRKLNVKQQIQQFK